MDSSPSYSVENSLRFQWSSMTGALNPDRVQHLERHLCGHDILDAGCGGGAFVEFLSARGFKVTGVDYHEMFLDVARRRPGAVGTYLRGDITALPFPDKSFDATYCFDVLEHVDDQRALRELLRVTRSRVIIAVPASDLNNFGETLTFYHYQDHTHLRTYTNESLAALFRGASQDRFEIIPELPLNFQTLATDQLAPAQTSNPLKAFARNFYHRILRRMLRHARYRSIYSGWVGVIEVAGAGAAGPSAPGT